MTFPSNAQPEHLYFITATLCGWKPLFDQPEYALIILNSLNWLRKSNRIFLFAYVLMPSHLHMIIKPRENPIGGLVQQFGSYTAHAILKQLREDGCMDLVDFFQAERRDPRHRHSIWQDIQAKNIFTRGYLTQKLEYIHNNPLDKQWQLAACRSQYPYSSACFYDENKLPLIEVDDVRELF